jgi:hypothetical protein
MPEHFPPGSEHLGNSEPRHETSDLRLRGVILFAVGLTVVAIIVHLIIAGLMAHFGAREERHQRPVNPLAAENPDHMPPEPRLEGIDPEQRGREGERGETPDERALHRYGWVEEGKVAHIPIEEAMKRLAGKLPAKEDAGAAAPAMPSSASSGRTPEGGRP